MAIDLKDQKIPDEKLGEDLEQDLQPKDDKKEETKPVEDEGQKIPYHQDPNVQLYIERQVAKRVGEGNKAWEDRIEKLESRIQQSAKTDAPVNISGWTPATTAEAQAAKAIIAQAKREMLDDLSEQDTKAKEQQVQDDRAFADWLGELRVVGTLKDDKDEQEFARLIVEYSLNDRKAAVNLWNKLQTKVTEAKDEAKKEGEEEGIKKAQEAKLGSARKGNEPGATGRSYGQRRAEEPNFSAILDREMNRLGY